MGSQNFNNKKSILRCEMDFGLEHIPSKPDEKEKSPVIEYEAPSIPVIPPSQPFYISCQKF